MLVSVGCDPTLNDRTNIEHSPVAKSMERSWPYLMERFPWAMFLSEGAFKRVYKVWNRYGGAYEALSVMDVDTIGEKGNLNLVGAELAVSVLLSSLARRNICPNFVITHGFITCQRAPSSVMGW
mmetsp:Transcript_8999/g.19432  ORF Transcript_8999/g.19432 Transcript_8999/m.19432 type:complete len:124 (-) Transcript_8999:812-1183(-)